MSAPVDDFDLDIRLGTLETVGGVAAVATEVHSRCQTYCNSYCTTGCPVSDCICDV